MSKLKTAANYIELGKPAGIVINDYSQGLLRFECRVVGGIDISLLEVVE
jgi:hypothetical protein